MKPLLLESVFQLTIHVTACLLAGVRLKGRERAICGEFWAVNPVALRLDTLHVLDGLRCLQKA